MNNKFVVFIKNFSLTLVSNLTSFIISILVIIIIPKIIGIEEFGFWQLYLLYTTYIGFLHFGWNDGIYLRYGGESYQNLNKKLFFSQFLMLVFFQLLFSFFVYLGASLLIENANKLFVTRMVAFALLIVNTRYMLLYILQATNRIQEYAKITILDRVIYFLLIVLFMLFGTTNYKLMIIADLLGKMISLAYAMFWCKDIVFQRLTSFYLSFSEMLENISVGLKLMVSNIASMLIIGIVRFGVEYSWDIETFGKISLTLSVSNLMMLFINALGIMMFPILRRTDTKKLPDIYLILRDILLVVLLSLHIAYYPLKTVLSIWLPQYAQSLMYMAMLFPIFLFEGKVALLINTYLKALRMERLMLKINLLTMCFSIVFTYFTTYMIKDLSMAVISIVLLLAFRSILYEIILSKLLSISIYKDIVLEISITVIFIFSGWYINSWNSTLIFVFCYLIYIFIKRKSIANTIKQISFILLDQKMQRN